jgi:hypothetical protein
MPKVLRQHRYQLCKHCWKLLQELARERQVQGLERLREVRGERVRKASLFVVSEAPTVLLHVLLENEGRQDDESSTHGLYMFSRVNLHSLSLVCTITGNILRYAPCGSQDGQAPMRV